MVHDIWPELFVRGSRNVDIRLGFSKNALTESGSTAHENVCEAKKREKEKKTLMQTEQESFCKCHQAHLFVFLIFLELILGLCALLWFFYNIYSIKTEIESATDLQQDKPSLMLKNILHLNVLFPQSKVKQASFSAHFKHTLLLFLSKTKNTLTEFSFGVVVRFINAAVLHEVPKWTKPSQPDSVWE